MGSLRSIRAEHFRKHSLQSVRMIFVQELAGHGFTPVPGSWFHDGPDMVLFFHDDVLGDSLSLIYENNGTLHAKHGCDLDHMVPSDQDFSWNLDSPEQNVEILVDRVTDALDMELKVFCWHCGGYGEYDGFWGPQLCSNCEGEGTFTRSKHRLMVLGKW